MAGIALGILGSTTGRVEAVSCTLVAANRVSITSTAESVITISRDADSMLGDAALRVNGIPCGTLRTIDALDIQGSTGREDLVLDQANGRFVDPSDNSEILFTGNLGTGDPNTLRIAGRSAAENYTFGQTNPLRATLNADAATEITLSAVGAIFVDTFNGNDRISGAGTNGTSLALSATAVPMTVAGGGGNDTIIGGSGADTTSYTGVSMPVLVDLGAGTANGELTGTDSLTSIENATGGSSNDTFIDNPGVCNVVTGGPGNDRFKALNRPTAESCDAQGNGDRFFGQGGVDTYDAFDVPAESPGVKFDFVNNIVRGSETGDICDDCENGEGTNAGDDEFIDDPNECNTFRGHGDDDRFIAANRPGGESCGTGDRFEGGSGRDTYDATIVPANSPGVVFDFVNAVVHGSGSDVCIDCEEAEGSEAGGDVFHDDPNECNVFNGNRGDDTFVAVNRPGTEPGGEGFCGDIFDGGEGGETNGDTYDASKVPADSPGVKFDFVNDIVHGSGTDTCSNCENGTGTRGDDEFIDEDHSCNGFIGGEGDDLFYAGVQRPGSEDDPEHGNRPDGQPGDGRCGDIVDLGEGREISGDTLDYSRTEHNSPGVKIDLPRGVISGSPEDTGHNAENATGSPGDDEIVGSDENNVLIGGDGDDIIYGGEGDDTIFGGPGNDTIDGGPGNNTIDGGPGNNTVTTGPSGIYCNLTTGTLVMNGTTTSGVTSCPAGGPDDDVFIGDANTNTFTGGGGNDRLEGGGGHDFLYGGDGNDRIEGGAGNDNLYGENGADLLLGGDGNDNAYGGEGDDEIRGGAGRDNLFGEGGNDRLFGEDDNDAIDGGAGNDAVEGGNGRDSIKGGDGDDRLDGGPDNDNIDGGAGTDQCTTGESVTNCEL